MMPDTGTDTPRISIVVDSASPPVISIADWAISPTTPVFTKRADHDEQPGEEQQRLPLDAAEIVGSVHSGNQYQDASTHQRHDRRLDVQHRMREEGREHQDEYDSAFDE